ncbi:hypothetical protein PR048_020057 [Dryococelus australis]|uniref:Uncharacterized protein n=1 Tax=Dryococelus australis TaxID=614101 RepID=A0ABQ9H577_9NEOP|nr:hypothetical protein PR048_020057 [Dryococelus australis]
MWGGIWTDMFIEQTLMKSTKGRSGITHGGGMMENQRASWVLSHSTCSAVTMAIHLLTKSRHFDSQLHVELLSVRQSRDLQDIRKMVVLFFTSQPFQPRQCIRKTDKSALARHLDGVTSDNASNIHCDTYHVLDGGTLLQLVVWLTAVTYSDFSLIQKPH